MESRIGSPSSPSSSSSSPAPSIPADPPGEVPQEATALCLSEGGYGAVLFHLGAPWRFNEAGYLLRLRRVSSVSGSSVTGSVLGLEWPSLNFDGLATAMPYPVAQKAALADVATRLAGVPATLRERPINWGYTGCAAAQRGHVEPALPRRQDFHCPAARVGQEEDPHE